MHPSLRRAPIRLPIVLLAALLVAACRGAPAGPRDPAAPQPGTPAAFVAEGDARLAESQWEDAEAAYRAAIEKDPDYAPAWSHLAYLHLFDPVSRAAALDEARQATELAPQSAEAWAYLARAQDWNGDFDDARASGERAVALDPQHADAQSFLGEVYTDLRLYPEAEKAARRAVALDPGNAEAHRNLGYLYSDMGRKDDALAEWTAAHELQPRFVHRWTTLASFHLHQRKDLERAREWLDGALALDPDDVQALLTLARLEEDEGNAQAAFDACKRVQAAAPDTIEAHNCLGNRYMDREEYALAEQSFRLAMAADPDDPYAYLNLGYTYYLSSRCEDALPQFQKASDLYPRSGGFRAAVGLAQMCLGDLDAASEAYEQAAELEPYEGDHHLGLARVHLQQQEVGKAERELSRAIELDSEQAAYYFWMAQVKEAQAKTGESLENFRKAMTLDTRSSTFASALGFAYLRQGDEARALEAFQEAAARIERYSAGSRQMAEAYFGMGAAQARSGDCRAAAGSLERSLALSPGFEAAQTLLVQCRQQLGLADLPLPPAIVSGGPIDDDGALLVLRQTLENWGIPAEVRYERLQGGARALIVAYLTQHAPGSPEFIEEQSPIVYAASWMAVRASPEVDGALIFSQDAQGNRLNVVVVQRHWALAWATGLLTDRGFASLWQEVR